MRINIRPGALLCVLLAVALFPDSARGEWPGLWEAKRNAVAVGPLSVEAGVEAKEVWRRPIGGVYLEIAMVAGRGYTLFTNGETDYLTAFELVAGKEIWRSPMGATYKGFI